MTEKEIEEYKKFMYNKENEYNCKECPENLKMYGYETQLPCGQQNCWVTCHCK